MRRNIKPVILDNLVSSSGVRCLAPEVVPCQAGRPSTKRLRLDKSRFSNPEESTIVCGLCGKRGHNKQTCLRRQNLTVVPTKKEKKQHSLHWMSFSLQ
jgi:hypothetical protein